MIASPAHAALRSRGPQQAALAACALVLIAIVCFGAVYTTIWVAIALAAFAALAWQLVSVARKKLALPGSSLLWPMLGFGALVCWQACHGSVYPYATRNGLVQLAAYGTLFYLAFYGFQRSASIRWVGTALWLFAGCLAFEAIAQHYSANGWIYWFHDARYGSPTGPFVYHNYFAGCMDLLMPIAVGAAFLRARGDWSMRARRALPVVLALIAIIMSQSRGGLFTLLFETALSALYWYPALAARPRLRRRASWTAAALIAAISLASWGPMEQRLEKLQHGDPSATDRIEVARACLRIWRDYPWLGSGFGTFATLYPKYESFDNGLNWDHAHNEYAQALAETGLVGMALVLSFAVLLIGLAARLRPEALTPATVLAQCAFVGAMGFLFHSAGDFLFHAPSDGMLFFLLTGMVAARARHLLRRARAAAKPRATLRSGVATVEGQ